MLNATHLRVVVPATATSSIIQVTTPGGVANASGTFAVKPVVTALDLTDRPRRRRPPGERHGPARRDRRLGVPRLPLAASGVTFRGA